jgi:hypothetical protein
MVSHPLSFTYRRLNRTVMVNVKAITETTVITMVIIGPPFRPNQISTAR